ncbi:MULTISPECIES: hypothetical protein [Streptomyces]|nr:hypothetical protein [Streptomyces ruber]
MPMYFLRRAVTVCAAAAALAVAGAPAAPAAEFPAAGSFPPPGDGDGHFHHHHHGRHERPLNFGPFEIPRRGDVNGGLSWNLSGREH